MNGYGCHTFAMYDKDNHRVWVKFHFKTQQGIKNLTDAEAEALVGKDRESHQRDLFDSIEKGDFPRWTLSIQVMTEEEANQVPFNPFDVTKVWTKKKWPLIEVGVMELNRNPENYFQDVEQAVFTLANIVPGVGYSPDRMLQARLFSYGVAQGYRLGINHHQIPVNKSRNEAHSFHRDGDLRLDGNYGGTLGYDPNSFGEWQDQPDFSEPPYPLEGDADRYDFHADDNDYYSQPRELFKLMSSQQKQALYDNTARNMGDAPKEIKIRHIVNCWKVDPAYGEGVAKASGIPMGEVPAS